MLSAQQPAKDDHESIDVSEAFSRRGDSNTNGKITPSAYIDDSKPVPAWMRSKEPEGKYDKYGKRDDQPRLDVSDERYAKYARVDSRDSRINRTDDPRVRREDRSDYRKKHQSYSTSDTGSRSTNSGETPTSGASYQLTNDTQEPAAYLRTTVKTRLPQEPAGYQAFHMSLKNRDSKDINTIVRTHYNQKAYHSRVVDRSASPIIKLRHFNNAIKYMLLADNVERRADGCPIIILDLCCGKGGDLNKCEFVGANQLIGIDISDASIKEAFKRYSQNKARFIPQVASIIDEEKRIRDSRKYNFEACFATGDCFTQTIPEVLEPNFPGIVDQMFPVDCVSIQFALHYAFETEEKVKMLLNNVSRSLRPGGTFIGTIPSSDFIREKIVNKRWVPSEDGKKKFGNGLYSVTFHEEPAEDGSFKPPFGITYDYSLQDAIDNVPEYVVPFEVFRSMCEDYGLTLKMKKNFSDLFNERIPKYFSKLNKKLIEGMKRQDGKYGAEGLEKEAVAFYIAFAFEKVGA